MLDNTYKYIYFNWPFYFYAAFYGLKNRMNRVYVFHDTSYGGLTVIDWLWFRVSWGKSV